MNIIVEQDESGQKISSRLSVFTRGILLASKQVSAEASKHLSKPNGRRATFISGGEVLEPEGQDLASFIARSRFILHAKPAPALNFLSSLSLVSRPTILRFVFSDQLLYFQNSTRSSLNTRLWFQADAISGALWTSFFKSLRLVVPKFDEVGLFVPTSVPRNPAHYDTSALAEMGKLLEDETIDVLRLIYTDVLPARFNLCDCLYANWLIRPQAEQTIATYLRKKSMGEAVTLSPLPDRFAVIREDDGPEVGGAEAACGWSKAKAVFAVRRHAPGATRLRECRPMISEEA